MRWRAGLSRKLCKPAEIEVPVEDLLSPMPHQTLQNPHLSRALCPSLIRRLANDAESGTLFKVHSLMLLFFPVLYFPRPNLKAGMVILLVQEP